MIKLTDLLKEITEAKQAGDLYHFTPLSNLKKILETRVLFPNNEEQISTSIRPNMSTKDIPHQDMRTASIVRIMLDGNKISNKYKIRPFAYGEHGDHEDLGEEQIIVNGKEFPFIPYLKRIDIFLNKKDKVNSKILELLEKANIPYRVYPGTPISNIPYSQPKNGNPEDINIENIPKKEIYTKEDMYFPRMKTKQIELYSNKYSLERNSTSKKTVGISPEYPDYYLDLGSTRYIGFPEYFNLNGEKINIKEKIPIPMYNNPKWRKMWKQVKPPYNFFHVDHTYDSYVLIPKNEIV